MKKSTHRHAGDPSGAIRYSGTISVAAAFAAAAVATYPACAAPIGGVVTAGAGAITREGDTTAIRQNTTRMVIDWNSFSSAAGESIVFRQADATFIALNRVTGTGPSQLLGSLSANGQVFILNPNGVLFGPGAQVNVRGMLASTLGMDNVAFMNGSQVLQAGAASGARVVNQGNLRATDGGYVALVGPVVSNQGTISTAMGDTLLAAGDKVTLRIEGGSLMAYSLDRGSIAALADNSAGGVISADGGRVVLAAGAADALSKAVVNQAGVIEAHTLSSHEGTIRLIGDPVAGQVQLAGTLDASAPDGGNGGFIETSAARVKVADGARVTTRSGRGQAGTWLIDPVDFYIDYGSGTQTDSSIGATALGLALAGGNIRIATSTGGAGSGNGDIHVNGDVEWGANKLTLQAQHNINFNASLRGGSVALMYGQASTDGGAADYFLNNGAKIDLNTAGGTFSTQKGTDPANLKDYTIVRSLGNAGSTDRSTLQGMSGLRSADNYVLGADIDATPSRDWNFGAGFEPVRGLLGTLDGLGHTVNGLYINQAGTLVGLFTFIERNAAVRNLGVTGASISGDVSVGAITGFNAGTISNTYVTGAVQGAVVAGGLAGHNEGSLANTYSGATVTGSQSTGGLAGENTAGGSISDSYADGTVVGLAANGLAFYTGGLVGLNEAVVSGSYASGSVTGNAGVGGLVGLNRGRIENSYAQAGVDGTSGVGGLAGVSDSGALIMNAYAGGKVAGTDSASTGGLVGIAGGAGTGVPAGIVSNSYWNTDLVGGTGLATSGAGEGRTSVQMQQAATFIGWDIARTGGTQQVWRIYEGHGMPLLRSFLAPLALELSRAATYTGAVVQNDRAPVPTVGMRTGIAASGRNVGIHQPYSNQLGYDISGGDLSIAARPLEVSAAGTDKTYDGTVQAFATLSDNRIAGDALSLSYASASFDDKNVGAARAVTVSGVAVSGSDALNYTYDKRVVTSASIRPKPLIITASSEKKVFDGIPYSGGNGVTYSGFIPGESESALGGQLRYGGDAQGAVGPGSYQITAGGLGSANYASAFVDGTLLILAPVPDGTPLTPLTPATPPMSPTPLEPLAPAAADVELVIATVPAGTEARSPNRQFDPRGQRALDIRVLDCGITLPESILLDACSP